MNACKKLFLVLVGIAAPAAALNTVPAAERPSTLQIGVVKTLLRDTPEKVVTEALGALIENQSGMKTEMFLTRDAQDLAERLKTGKVNLGVFSGVEFAWAQRQVPQLKAFMIAVSKRYPFYAKIIVRDDSKATSFDDLQGKAVAVPRRSRIHCHLFVAKQCLKRGADPEQFFAAVPVPSGAEAALDDVLRGKVEAAVVDNVGLESYQREKPGCFARLKTLMQSEAFPPMAVVRYPGAIQESTLQEFRNILTRTCQTSLGRQMLAVVRLSGFEAVPADYQRMLDEIIKAYPAPVDDKFSRVAHPPNSGLKKGSGRLGELHSPMTEEETGFLQNRVSKNR